VITRLKARDHLLPEQDSTSATSSRRSSPTRSCTSDYLETQLELMDKLGVELYSAQWRSAATALRRPRQSRVTNTRPPPRIFIAYLTIWPVAFGTPGHDERWYDQSGTVVRIRRCRPSLIRVRERADHSASGAI